MKAVEISIDELSDEQIKELTERTKRMKKIPKLEYFQEQLETTDKVIWKQLGIEEDVEDKKSISEQ